MREAQNTCLPTMRFNSDRTVVPLPDHERLPRGSVADPLWKNPGRIGLPGSASRGALPAVPTGAGGVVTTADIRASCSWPSSGAVSHTPAGIDTPEADGSASRIARGRPNPLPLGRAPRDLGRFPGGARRHGDRRRRWPAQYETANKPPSYLAARPCTTVPQPPHRPRKTRQS